MRAALDLFSRYGRHGTSVDQIASAAGLSKSNLLYHFSNKDDLYVCVLRELLEVWLAPLRDFSAEQDPADALATTSGASSPCRATSPMPPACSAWKWYRARRCCATNSRTSSGCWSSANRMSSAPG